MPQAGSAQKRRKDEILQLKQSGSAKASRIAYVLAAFTVLLLSLQCVSSGAQDNLTWAAIKQLIRSRFPDVTQLSTVELAAVLKEDKRKPLLLDARTSEEFAVSHLPGAKLTPSIKEAVQAIGPLDKNYPIVVYCSVGYRSSELALKLEELGYENVENLEGSLFEWANEGRPLYSDSTRVHVVHPYNKYWGQLLRQELWYSMDSDSGKTSD